MSTHLPPRAPRALLLGLLLAGSPVQSALAEDDFQSYLRAAVQLYEDLEYERALTQLQRARRIARGVAQDVSLGVHEGILLAELGRWDEARTAFETALLLDPEAKLPLRVSPKLERQFESARERVRTTLASRQQRRDARPEVASDRPERRPSLKGRLVPPEPSAALTPTVEATSRPVPVVPLVLLGAGVVAGGVGSWLGVSARQQYDAALVEPRAQEANALYAQSQDRALAANVLFGTAGLAAVGAVVSWFLMPDGVLAPPSASASGESR
jgi:tetratricopeptide (TPR) repeat protein